MDIPGLASFAKNDTLNQDSQQIFWFGLFYDVYLLMINSTQLCPKLEIWYLHLLSFALITLCHFMILLQTSKQISFFLTYIIYKKLRKRETKVFLQ